MALPGVGAGARQAVLYAARAARATIHRQVAQVHTKAAGSPGGNKNGAIEFAKFLASAGGTAATVHFVDSQINPPELRDDEYIRISRADLNNPDMDTHP